LFSGASKIRVPKHQRLFCTNTREEFPTGILYIYIYKLFRWHHTCLLARSCEAYWLRLAQGRWPSILQNLQLQMKLCCIGQCQSMLSSPYVTKTADRWQQPDRNGRRCIYHLPFLSCIDPSNYLSSTQRWR